MRHEYAFEAGGQFAQEFEVLHGDVRAHDGEPRVDAECGDGTVHGDGFHEVAELAWRKHQGVAAGKNHFPDVGMYVEPIGNFACDIFDALERVVPAEAEAAAHTAGAG